MAQKNFLLNQEGISSKGWDDRNVYSQRNHIREIHDDNGCIESFVSFKRFLHIPPTMQLT